MTLEAVRTLGRAGIEVDPTLVFAFVGDEESGEPGSGVSAGARAFSALIASGAAPRPDMAIYVEPTMLDVYVAHMGFFVCDIRVTGKSAYFGVPELGVDALKGAHAVLDALWRYSAELSAGESHAAGWIRIRAADRHSGRRLYRGSRRMHDQPDRQDSARRSPG